MSDLSDKEKIKIATHFLLSSPPGEFNEVLTDVRSLLDDDKLLNQIVVSAFRQYNKDQMIDPESPSLGYNVLITESGEVDANSYLDPRSGKVLGFNHIDQKFTGDEQQGSPNNDPIQKKIDLAINQYISQHFPDGACAVYSDKGKYKIYISAKIFSPQNYWNGRWRSIWEMPARSGKGKLTGEIKTTVHFYEDGNVQLTTNKKIDIPITISDPDSTAKEVAKAIFNEEHSFQQSLITNFAQMGDTSFKSLRRKLPITGTRVDFLNILAHRVTDGLSKK
ncbi:f-actin-capping protein subunit alpha [Anaeramoeba ignava]|uniref:F-actin-capping protein subunit alpha n=1 Tax=Anaeramoeba ignava TaxID=1746090 RepID=A0A9Q0LLL6_ANAIG|nr:f-actin-capping protein subunit alpha [Anaeramoeba ignava]|eukprot:Anaeramoba_ignava/a613664_355.p1 GENE.a613664_355~~a613664_355.p1  ORF type:complete len:278 (-),score=105.54 a613664_355:119-952(-)